MPVLECFSGIGGQSTVFYGTLGQPTQAGGYATNAVWGADGQLASFTYGNGTVRTVTRNDRGLPERIRDDRSGASVIDELLAWDANGNLGSQIDGLNLSGGTRTMAYDGRDRLASAWISGYGTESFVWDAFDRLRTRTSWAGTDSYSYDGTHRLASINGPSGFRSYTHDARGNVTGRPGYTHAYDAVNRLVQTQPVGGSVETYEYDGHGRRTAMVRSNGSIKVDYYTRDGVLRASADTGMGSTGGSAVYVHLGDVLVAQDAWAWRSPFGMTFFHVDHQGTPIARSDAWGVVFERTRRGSFGLPLVGPLKNGPGYTGHMEDPGTGLVYMQQRYYDPAIARFLSVDPVGPLADPTNHFGRYHYGLNNPYRYTDPDGREPKHKHKPSTCTGTRIPTDGCGAFPGNQGASFGRNTGSGDPVADAEVADLRRARAPLAEGVQEAGQAASAIGDGIETIYLAAIPVPGAAIAGAARAGATVFKTGHYATRLSREGVDVVRAERSVAERIDAMRLNMSAGAEVRGRFELDGVLLEYRAYMLPNGSVSVGTIFPVRP